VSRFRDNAIFCVLRDGADIEVEVECRLVDESFDHEFGTERAWGVELGRATRTDTGEPVELTAAELRQAEQQAWDYYFN
jgi:hypothetical protein